MADLTKNVVSLMTLVLFMIGAAFTIIGIFRTNQMSEKNLDEAYIIPSQVLNGLTVMFLLYLTSTSNFTPLYKLLVIIVLVGGMMLEIYLTTYSDREAESIAAYVFITTNFLIRAFLLIELVQGEWVTPMTRSAKPIQQAVKDTFVRPLTEAVKEVASPLTVDEKPSSDDISAYKDRWRAVVKDVKANNTDVDGSTIATAWRVIDEAVKNNEFTKEHLKEALDKVKNKDGTDVSGVTVGGRKRS
jgi:hypothetical protein